MKLLEILTPILLLTILNSCISEGLNMFKSTQLKIVQRGSQIIEGSSKSKGIKISLEDITKGSTTLKIEDIKDEKLYFQNNLKAGDTESFKYEDNFYTVKIDSFENHLFHDDFAFVTITYVSDEVEK